MQIAVFLILSFVLIVVASELFTNAIEWAGYRLHLARGATGSLLASLGTAMPETIIPIIALFGGQSDARDIATGAIIGAPFLLLTLGIAVTGIAVVLRRGSSHLVVEASQVRRDIGTYVIAAAGLLVATILPTPFHWLLAALLIVGYLVYVRLTLKSGSPHEAMPEPLHVTRWMRPTVSNFAIAVQLIVAIGLLIVAGDLFVTMLSSLAPRIGINQLVLALILAPVATELPETLNSVIWIRSNDDGLAFGNVAGATAFQACILGMIGLAFTPWTPGLRGVLTIALTMVTAAYLLFTLRGGKAHGMRLVSVGVIWVAMTAGLAAVSR